MLNEETKAKISFESLSETKDIKHNPPTEKRRLCFCNNCRKLPIVILKGKGWVRPSETRLGYDPTLRAKNIKKNNELKNASR